MPTSARQTHRTRRGGLYIRPSAARPLRGRVDEGIDPYKLHRTRRGGLYIRPSVARPLRGRVDEGIDPYKLPLHL